MGYCLSVFLVDAEKLRGVVGSKNETLLEEIREKYIAELEPRAADPGELSLDQGLERLIKGSAEAGEENHQYGYALWLLCRHIGRQLISKCFAPIHFNSFYQAFPTELIHATQNGAPIDLPPIRDFPSIGWMPRGDGESVGGALTRASEEKASTAPDRQEGFTEALTWVTEAQKEQKDLVFFLF